MITTAYKRELAVGDILTVSVDQDQIRVQTRSNCYPSTGQWLTPGQARELRDMLDEALFAHAELYGDVS
jgi:hypothetical protein